MHQCVQACTPEDEVQSSGQSHLEEAISADMAVQPSSGNVEDTDTLRLWDRCSSWLNNSAAVGMWRRCLTQNWEEMNLHSPEWQVPNKTPDQRGITFIDHFTVPTRQNFTEFKFYHDVESSWLLGTTEISVKSVPVISCEHVHHLMWVTPVAEFRRAFYNPSTTCIHMPRNNYEEFQLLCVQACPG